jgi:alpha-beta hydrolase superfamily lysophospholipase
MHLFPQLAALHPQVMRTLLTGTEVLRVLAVTLMIMVRMGTLMLQSGDDRVTAAAVSERFFSAAGSGDKTWRLYPESRHELFDDLDRDVVMEELACWLEAHGRWPEGVIRADPAQPPEGLVSVTSP